jgi:hypothetical protein
MSHSAEINHLAKALAAAQSSLSPAAKDAVNPHFRNHYASLGSVWDAAREVLGANGLSVVQTYAPNDGSRLDLVTTLLHESGQWISGTISMVPAKADPQGIGSAATYARRYSLASILGIVADEDDDGQKASMPSHAPAYQAPIATVMKPSKPVSVPSQPQAAPAAANDGSWRSMVVPKFIKKYAGQTLGDMPQRDLEWWAGNYTPKEFRGVIAQADLDLRSALDQATGRASAKPAAAAPEPKQAELTDDTPDDVPF